jgi:hypothetical protein
VARADAPSARGAGARESRRASSLGRAWLAAAAIAIVAGALFVGYRVGAARAPVVQVSGGGDGTLVLENVPRRGQLSIDGVVVPVRSGTMRLEMPPGPHRVTLAIGRFEYEDTVVVPAGGEEVLRVPVRRLRKKGAP